MNIGKREYLILVSKDRCTMVTIWSDGNTTVAFRTSPEATWGPPITVEEETQ
jgi:hypothetical protein